MPLILKPKPLNNFAPMLAPNESFTPETLKELNLNLPDYYMSPKLDGIRCVIKKGQLLSRSLKPLPNSELSKQFAILLNVSEHQPSVVFDGEIYSPKRTFQELVSYTMTHYKELPSDVKFHCFDFYCDQEPTATFAQRLGARGLLEMSWKLYEDPNYINVPQVSVSSEKNLYQRFSVEVEAGGEGLILKKKGSLYKFNRATVQEATCFKLKPWKTFDAEIVDVVQGTKVDPDVLTTTNELGRSVTSRKKDDRMPDESLAAFVVLFEGKEVKVSLSSTTHAMRQHYYLKQKELIGKMIEYKGTQVGAKNVPRHPVFIRFREDKENTST